MTNRGAIAVFVKTPGHSPVKTRLAASVGVERAEELYRLCLTATEAVVARACRVAAVDGYWAVAESNCLHLPRWRSLPAISQGVGGLGDRLDFVYGSLLERHPFVLLVGADAPLLSAEAVLAAATAMTGNHASFAISRASDGGYVMFAGRMPLPREVWTSVPYSASNTAEEFISRLRRFGEVIELEPFDDVDVIVDLRQLIAAENRVPLPEQRAVVDFARRLVADVSGDG
ncbi:MAG: DUF2064 domain-containing protein [Planctomycetota bacterium]|nr:DUF2064 domain-containing protein [Planctomycetota bacterium]